MTIFGKLISFFSTEDKQATPNPTQNNDSEVPQKTEESRRSTTYADGMVHAFRSTVGTGILAFPSAFRESGYVVGVFGIIFVTYLTRYCCSIMANCYLELLSRNTAVVPTYQGIFEASFKEGPKSMRPLAPAFLKTTNILLLLMQLGGGSVYLLFIGSNIKEACAGHLDLELQTWCAILSVPILLFSLAMTLRQMSFISSAGNLILLLSVGILFYYFLREPLSFEDRRAFGQPEDLPSFFGTAFFASSCLIAVMPLMSEMINPSQMNRCLGILDMNAILTGTLYVIFGFLGYLRYGDEAKGSVTLNLPTGDRFATGVQVLLALSVMSATSLMNYITVSIIWDDYFEKRAVKNRLVIQYVLRLVVVAVTFVVAICMPRLELLLSITGMVGQVTLGSTFLILIHILVFYKQPSTSAYISFFWRDALVMLFNVYITWASFRSIYDQLKG